MELQSFKYLNELLIVIFDKKNFTKDHFLLKQEILIYSTLLNYNGYGRNIVALL